MADAQWDDAERADSFGEQVGSDLPKDKDMAMDQPESLNTEMDDPTADPLIEDLADEDASMNQPQFREALIMEEEDVILVDASEPGEAAEEPAMDIDGDSMDEVAPKDDQR